MPKPIRYARSVPRFDVPPDITNEIGRLTVRCAHLEYILQSIIWNLAQVTLPIGRLAIREPRAEERINLIKDLAELRGVEVEPVAPAGIMSRAKDFGRNRDILVHGHWFFGEDEQQWFVILTRGKWAEHDPHPQSKSIVPEALKVTKEAVQEIVLQAEQTIKLAMALAAQVESQIQPPPEVPPEQFPRRKPKPSRGPSRPPHRPEPSQP